MPQGKKICPQCDEVLGVRTQTCPECEHKFVKAVKKAKKKGPKKDPKKDPKGDPKQEPEVEEKHEEQEVPKKKRKVIMHYKEDPKTLKDIFSCLKPMKATQNGHLWTCIGPVIVGHLLEPDIPFNAMYPKITIDTETGTVSVFKGKKEDEEPNVVFEGMCVKEQ